MKNDNSETLAMVAEMLRKLQAQGQWQEGDMIIISRTADGAEIAHDKSNRVYDKSKDD